MNNEHKDHKISLPNFDFERTSYISETDLEKDKEKVENAYPAMYPCSPNFKLDN